MRIGELFQVGVGVLRTIVSETGAILAQTGDAATDTTEADRVSWWQHVGFLSRPPKAVPKKKSCESITIRYHDSDIIIASRDLRGLELAGTLEEGETMVYAAGEDGKGQARILLKKNGNVVLFTRQGNVDGGEGVTIQANADGTICASSKFGSMRLDSDGWKFGCGLAALQLNASGEVALIGTSIAINGASVSLGANAVMPVVWGPAGLAGVGSTSVKVAI